MNIRTRDHEHSPIRALVGAQGPINSESYRKMLDQAVEAYEHSKVVSDRQLELLTVGVEVPSHWGTLRIHNN